MSCVRKEVKLSCRIVTIIDYHCFFNAKRICHAYKESRFHGTYDFLVDSRRRCNLSSSICPNKFPSNRTAKPRGT